MVAPRWPLTQTFGLLVVCLTILAGGAAGAGERASRPVVLLVNGIVEDVNHPSRVWGELDTTTDTPRWTGMVGALESAGYRFGGVIRPERSGFELPRDLDVRGASAPPAEADCFWLQFSQTAATDGVALKALELASAIAKVRALTGTAKVDLVTHSAGGVIARAYVQSALTDHLAFRHDVDRVITIAAPHLGSALAEHWGDWLGTRATSLKTTARLLHDLNDELELPADVSFASIVVRGIWRDVDGDGEDYDPAIDQEFLADLPADFWAGGDQVLSVRTQNLRLARCAARYEEQTGRAVQYLVARVRKQSDELIHNSCPLDDQVQDCVRWLLADDGGCFGGFEREEDCQRWVDRQAPVCVFGCLEEQTSRDHWCAGVKSAAIRVACEQRGPEEFCYGVAARATWRRHVVGFFESEANFAGRLRVKSDRFGRVRGCSLESADGVELATDLDPRHF